MRWILWGAVAAGLVLGGSAGTFAQSMGMMSMGYGAKPRYYAPPKPAPRVKRYYYRGKASKAPGTCGLYKYWSAGTCKDARTSPPKLN